MIEHFTNRGYTTNRWFDRYFKLIEYYQNVELDEYEKHHILPKFIFPEFANISQNSWNMIKLPIRAHFIAHYILAKALDDSMWKAVVFIYDTRKFGKNTKSRLYQEAKRKANLALSIRQTGKNNISHRPDVKLKQKQSLKKYYETNDGHNKGKLASDETKLKQSISAKNRSQPSRRKKYILTSPSSVTYQCNGTLKSTVIKLSLSLNTLKTNLGECVPKTSEHRKQYNTQLRENTTGWKLEEVTNFQYHQNPTNLGQT